MPPKLGRGLDALLSRPPDGAARRAELKAKLSNIEAEHSSLKAKTADLRKKLTMEIVLGSNPDMTELRSMEGKLLDLELAKKEIMEELPDLEPDLRPPPKKSPAEKKGRSLEIDMEMIKIMISNPEGKGGSKGPGVDDSFIDETDEILKDLRSLQEDHALLDQVQEAIPVEEAPPPVQVMGPAEPAIQKVPEPEPPRQDERAHLESIKAEIHPKVTLRKLKEESSPHIRPPEKARTPIVVRKLSTVPSPGSAIVKKKVVRRVKARQEPPSGSMADLTEVLKTTSKMIEDGEFDAALPLLEKNLGRYGSEGDQSLLCQIGSLYFEKGDMERSSERFRQVVRMNPMNARAINNLGVILKKQKRFEESIRIINQAIEVDPNYERAWYELGCVFMEIEPPLLKEASIFLRRALEIDPRFERAREQLRLCTEKLQA